MVGDMIKEDLKNTSKDPTAQLAYKLLLQIRDLDNQLMWTRINIVLLIQGILFAFLASSFSSLIDKYPIVISLVEFFGLISAIFLFAIAKGSSFWVTYWQKKLAEIEQEAIGNFEIFRHHPAHDAVIKKEEKKEGYIPTRKTIIVFCGIFVAVWSFILIYTLYLVYGLYWAVVGVVFLAFLFLFFMYLFNVI